MPRVLVEQPWRPSNTSAMLNVEHHLSDCHSLASRSIGLSKSVSAYRAVPWMLLRRLHACQRSIGVEIVFSVAFRARIVLDVYPCHTMLLSAALACTQQAVSKCSIVNAVS